MFDPSLAELTLVAMIALMIIGPKQLPEVLRTLGLWLGRLRRSFVAVKTEIEKEIGMDEVRRQLHNEAILDEMKRIEDEVKATASDTRDAMTIHPAAGKPDTQPQTSSQTGSASETGAETAANEPVQEPVQEEANGEQTSENRGAG